jgi:hypothetical protein
VNDTATPAWSITGEGEIADRLRHAARFVPLDSPLTVLVSPGADADEAFALGEAALRTTAERVVPLEAAFEAVEAVRSAVKSAEVGLVYGCFTSVRITRGASSETLLIDALLPALGMTLDIVSGDVARVWANRASLFAPDDAWFVTIRMRDQTLLTIEAMASEPEGSGRSILLELTAAARVLRAEPTRQSIVIETFDGALSTAPWWEDISERYLHLVKQRALLPHDSAGTRLRNVWEALMASASSGEPVPPE